jgi:hypothetical protein
MAAQMSFFISVGFSIVVWSLVVGLFIWPRLQGLDRTQALRPILMLHSFRFEGLVFLVPGVVAPDLPASFAHAAAIGDITAASLALLSLALLPRAPGLWVAWIFNLWGSADLLNAFFQANRSGLIPGQLGAAYFVPTLFVPLLLVTHVVGFKILMSRPRPLLRPATV